MSAPSRCEESTFLFADIAGFTALTETHGDDTAFEICRRFTTAATAIAGEEGAEVVKTIGDAVMARVRDPERAVRIGERIVESLAEHRSPPVRVGLHTGVAIEEGGDYYGATVNLASRVSGAALPGEVLLTQSTRDALPAGFPVRPRGKRSFKNVAERVAVFAAAERPAGHELEIDPVCRMAVDRELAARSIRRHGRDHYFCSPRCADAFERQPLSYLVRNREGRAAVAGFRLHLRVFLIAQAAVVAIYAATVVLAGAEPPWLFLITVGWGVPLAMHYRAVRGLL